MRILISLLTGSVVAGLLFLLMNSMISTDEEHLARAEKEPITPYRHQDREERVERIDRRLPEPPEEREPPPTDRVTNTPDNQPRENIDIPPIDTPTGIEGIEIPGPQSQSRRENARAEPTVRVEPQWPRRAALQGIEGWVRVRFTIRADGTVTNASVVESRPGQLFDQAAIRAIQRWRFRPRIVDGRSVERQATQVFDFQLDDNTR